MTCLGSFDPSAATSGKSNAAGKAATRPDVKTEKAQRNSSGDPAVRNLPVGDKSAKASAGVVHNGVVDFTDEASAKKKQKKHQVTAKSQGKAIRVRVNGKLNPNRGGDSERLSGIKVKPVKRKQQS